MINTKLILESLDEGKATKEDEKQALKEMPKLVKELKSIAESNKGSLCRLGKFLALCFKPDIDEASKKKIAKEVKDLLKATTSGSDDGSWVYPGIVKTYGPYIAGWNGVTKGKETMEVEKDTTTLTLKIYSFPGNIALP